MNVFEFHGLDFGFCSCGLEDLAFDADEAAATNGWTRVVIILTRIYPDGGGWWKRGRYGNGGQGRIVRNVFRGYIGGAIIDGWGFCDRIFAFRLAGGKR